MSTLQLEVNLFSKSFGRPRIHACQHLVIVQHELCREKLHAALASEASMVQQLQEVEDSKSSMEQQLLAATENAADLLRQVRTAEDAEANAKQQLCAAEALQASLTGQLSAVEGAIACITQQLNQTVGSNDGGTEAYTVMPEVDGVAEEAKQAAKRLDVEVHELRDTVSQLQNRLSNAEETAVADQVPWPQPLTEPCS